MIVFINPASTLIHLHFLCVLSTICDFWLLNKYKFHFNCNLFQNLLPFCPYHFVRTILSILLSPCHFVRYHFVRSPTHIMSFTTSSFLLTRSPHITLQSRSRYPIYATQSSYLFKRSSTSRILYDFA